jgi:hypothetical protein
MERAISLKLAISSIDNWVLKEKILGTDPMIQFNECNQSCNLMIMNKSSLIDENVRNEACPNLNSSQILQILKQVNYYFIIKIIKKIIIFNLKIL